MKYMAGGRNVANFLAFLVLSIASIESYAIGEKIINAVMRSDFVFDRDTSNVPFFPLSYLTASKQDSLTFDAGCSTNNQCEFDYQSYSQALGVPVWVGQKNMLVLAETLDSDHFEFSGSKLKVNSAGLLATWITQSNSQWQVGVFTYYYRNIGNEEFKDETSGSYNGAVARHRHSEKFHSYWGLVYHTEQDETLLFPYLGFDWYLDKEWSISGVMPWPTLNYSPDPNNLFRVGALYSGSTWTTNQNNEIGIVNFGKINVGFSYERKLQNQIWGALTLGKSSFGNFSIKSNAGIELKSRVDSSWYFEVGINMRPSTGNDN